MTTFRLHLIDAETNTADAEELDLPSLHAARRAAVDGIRGLLGEQVTHTGALDLRGRIDIKDQSGFVVMMVSFEDAVTVTLP